MAPVRAAKAPSTFTMSRHEMAKTYGTGYKLMAKMGFADASREGKGLVNPLEVSPC